MEAAATVAAINVNFSLLHKKYKDFFIRTAHLTAPTELLLFIEILEIR